MAAIVQVAQLQMRAAQPSNSPGVPGGRMMGGYLNDFPTGDDGTLLEASDAFRANFSAGKTLTVLVVEGGMGGVCVLGGGGAHSQIFEPTILIPLL